MKIAVFCGSRMGNRAEFAEAAEKVGRWIGSNNHNLIYGGGDIGLMGITARAVKENGGMVTGVIPENIEGISNRSQPYTTEIIWTVDMNERKKKMEELADGFIALPGGIGTLDEISEVITLVNLGVINKPSVLFNTDGFYQPLKQMLDNMISNGFLKEKDIDKLLVSADLSEIEAFFAKNMSEEE